MDAFVEKPIEPDAAGEKVAELLAKRAGGTTCCRQQQRLKEDIGGLVGRFGRHAQRR